MTNFATGKRFGFVDTSHGMLEKKNSAQSSKISTVIIHTIYGTPSGLLKIITIWVPHSENCLSQPTYIIKVLLFGGKGGYVTLVSNCTPSYPTTQTI